MKPLNYYALILSLAFIILVVLYARSCRTDPPQIAVESKQKYDSVVKVVETANNVVTYLNEKYSHDSAAYEAKIEYLEKTKASADVSAHFLKKKVADLTTEYQKVKNDPVLARVYCDSLIEENNLLAGELENQMIMADSIVYAQEKEIGKLRTLVQAEKDFRNKFLSADAVKDKQYKVLYDSYNKLHKKSNGWWKKWGEKTTFAIGGAAVGVMAGKTFSK